MAEADSACEQPFCIGSKREESIMNKDQVKGRVEEAAGNIKKVTGHAVGNSDLASRGAAEETAGKVRKTYGDLKEDVKKQLNKP